LGERLEIRRVNSPQEIGRAGGCVERRVENVVILSLTSDRFKGKKRVENDIRFPRKKGRVKISREIDRRKGGLKVSRLCLFIVC